MTNSFTRQVRGFFIASLKIQSRNLLILALGFILPIVMIYGFEFTAKNSFSKIRVGVVQSASLFSTSGKVDDSDYYGKAVDLLSNSDDFYQIVALPADSINTELASNRVDVILVPNITSNSDPYGIKVRSFDGSKLRNRLMEITVSEKLARNALSTSNVKNRTNIYSDVIPLGTGDILEPLLAILLAFSIVICCLSMNDLNIFNSRDNLALRRVFVAPAYPVAYLLGQSLARITYCLMQISFTFFVMLAFFGYRPSNIAIMLPQVLFLVIVTCIIYILQNLILAVIVKKDKYLNIINSIVLLSQFVLITDFLPIRSIPQVVNAINFLPIAAFARAVSDITSGGLTLFTWQLWNSLAVLFVWLIVLGFISKRLFKLRQ
jgi:ABC-type multidrug transport system permease subunit